MLDEFLRDMTRFVEKDEPFATATVVLREAPSSGKVGDKAVISQEGEMTGWVGGGCVHGVVMKEAAEAIKTGRSRLVRIGNTPGSGKNDGVMEYRMTCQSEGTLEIFIEPVLPKPHLLVIGTTAIARSLAKMAGDLGYRVTAVAEGVTRPNFPAVDELVTHLDLANVTTNAHSFIVVATQGAQDEKALQEALKKDRSYLGFVASRKKMAGVSQFLLDAGCESEAVHGIRSPVGIDIKAKSPNEVAVSILAEIIQVKNTQSPRTLGEIFDAGRSKQSSTPYYINPVCGVPIDKNHYKHVIEYLGEKVYFCCDECKIKFQATPEKYMNKVDSD